MLQSLSIFTLPALLIIAATSDFMSLRIPNWLTILTGLLFFPMAYATGLPLHDFGYHLLAGVILFVLGFLLFQFGLFGGGDAKLMAAAGLWFGTSQVIPFLVLTALAGGALALLIGIWSVFMLSWSFEGDKAMLGGLRDRLATLKPNIPYGFALAVGGILAFKDTWWMTTGLS